jgi:hypothetical protein
MRVAHLLTLAGLFAIFSNPAVAQPEPSSDLPLIAKPNPALAGVKELSVVVTAPDSEPNILADLRAGVTGRLYDAGFTVSSSPAGHIAAAPELRVNIGMLKLESCGQYVVFVQTSLARGVSLPGSDQLHIGADVWKVDSEMQAVAMEKMPDEVSDIVQQQMQMFISACSVAGVNDRQTDVNQTRPQSHKPTVEKGANPTKQQAVESKFVASKNSKVFHKPDCQFALKILPKNLVSYATRDEAIAAGKRPCKTCNP